MRRGEDGDDRKANGAKAADRELDARDVLASGTAENQEERPAPTPDPHILLGLTNQAVELGAGDVCFHFDEKTSRPGVAEDDIDPPSLDRRGDPPFRLEAYLRQLPHQQKAKLVVILPLGIEPRSWPPLHERFENLSDQRRAGRSMTCYVDVAAVDDRRQAAYRSLDQLQLSLVGHDQMLLSSALS